MKKGYMVLNIRSLREILKHASQQSKNTYGKVRAKACVVLSADIYDDDPQLVLSDGRIQISVDRGISGLRAETALDNTAHAIVRTFKSRED